MGNTKEILEQEKDKRAINFIKENKINYSFIEKSLGLDETKRNLYNYVIKNNYFQKKHRKAIYSLLEKNGFENKKTEIISIINNKGGVGKTTTTMNLGKALVLLGKKILLVDIDPQGNLTEGLDVNDFELQLSDCLLLESQISVTNIVYNIEENFDILPSNIELDRAGLNLKTNTIKGLKRLKKILEPIQEKYDYILIDCPPNLETFTGVSLIASTSTLLIVEPEPFSVRGIENILSLIEDTKEINEGLYIKGVLFTFVEGNTIIHKTKMEEVEKQFGNLVFRTRIRKNIIIPESNANRQSIFDYNPKSMGAKDYMDFAKEFLKR